MNKHFSYCMWVLMQREVMCKGLKAYLWAYASTTGKLVRVQAVGSIVSGMGDILYLGLLLWFLSGKPPCNFHQLGPMENK